MCVNVLVVRVTLLNIILLNAVLLNVVLRKVGSDLAGLKAQTKVLLLYTSGAMFKVLIFFVVYEWTQQA
jgi:hypothetical protein